jgi:hypothetical protein
LISPGLNLPRAYLKKLKLDLQDQFSSTTFFGSRGEFATLPLETELNDRSECALAVELTYRYLQPMRAKNKATILNVCLDRRISSPCRT